MKLHLVYALIAAALLVAEVAIALFAHDPFVRPYFGDVLAVALVYSGLRAATPLRLWSAVGISFAIACGVELGQYFHIVDLLGASDNRIIRTVLGVGFEPLDFLAYAGGGVGVVLVETIFGVRRPQRK